MINEIMLNPPAFSGKELDDGLTFDEIIQQSNEMSPELKNDYPLIHTFVTGFFWLVGVSLGLYTGLGIVHGFENLHIPLWVYVISVGAITTWIVSMLYLKKKNAYINPTGTAIFHLIPAVFVGFLPSVILLLAIFL